ncbi:MAG: Lrp/AsnC ligand binding domain-containing protein [Candidatus Methylarchaceae archaeon HK01M]|nr:Lrp/AsnC ligand binding domain-containing protein [Candidatus Methylarchaceae archaeon HK01M]
MSGIVESILLCVCKFIKKNVVIYNVPVTFILMSIDLGAEVEILKELEKIENVKEAYFVYGLYDIMVKVDAQSMEKVKETIRKIRGLDKIRSTVILSSWMVKESE